MLLELKKFIISTCLETFYTSSFELEILIYYLNLTYLLEIWTHYANGVKFPSDPNSNMSPMCVYHEVL